MPRLIFINRFFHPDSSATSQLLSDLAFHLAAAGHDVSVITSRQLSGDPARELPPLETVRGVRIHRVWGTRFGRQHLPTRALDYLTFYASATATLALLADAQTVVVAETDPPLISVPSAVVAAFTHSPLVNWTQDLFPEIALGLRVPGIAPFAPLLRRLRNLSLGHARTNVVLGEAMAARLRAEGVPPEKIAVIPNWPLPETEAAAAPEAVKGLRAEWNLAGKLVVGYSGNFGWQRLSRRHPRLAGSHPARARHPARPGFCETRWTSGTHRLVARRSSGWYGRKDGARRHLCRQLGRTRARTDLPCPGAIDESPTGHELGTFLLLRQIRS